MSSVAMDLTECLNCRASLNGPYCAMCGQKVTAPRPTVHEFVHDAFHEFLHFDGKILQSVRLLFTRPGLLTSEYVEGRRVRYISPLRLYLIFSVAYFAAAPRVMFLLVPIAALVVMALTRRARRTYIEHLYFALHVHAVCFGVLALAVVLGEPASPIVNAIVT